MSSSQGLLGSGYGAPQPIERAYQSGNGMTLMTPNGVDTVLPAVGPMAMAHLPYRGGVPPPPLTAASVGSCVSCNMNNWMHDAYSVFGPLGQWGTGTYGPDGYGRPHFQFPPCASAGSGSGSSWGWGHGGHGQQHMFGPGGTQAGSGSASGSASAPMLGPGGTQAMLGPGGSEAAGAGSASGSAAASPMLGPGGTQAMLGPGGTQAGSAAASPMWGPGGTRHLLPGVPTPSHHIIGPDGKRHLLPGVPTPGPAAPPVMPRVVVGPCGIPVLAGPDGVPIRDALGALVYPPMFGPAGCWQPPMPVEVGCGFGSAYACQPSVFGPATPVQAPYL